MRFILTVIAVMFALDGICWALLARLANRTAWRSLIALFMSVQTTGPCMAYFWPVVSRRLDWWQKPKGACKEQLMLRR